MTEPVEADGTDPDDVQYRDLVEAFREENGSCPYIMRPFLYLAYRFIIKPEKERQTRNTDP